MDKKDLEQIEKIVEKSEKRIVSILSNEISDLADINRAVITRTDEIDHRLKIVERRLGLISH